MARVWDVLALLVIAFVVWKLLIAPRSLDQATAHPAPHLVLASLNGQSFKLAEHRGRVVFLDFYASWCEPCKISLPLVERFARSHPEADVIPIDVGEPLPVALAFAKQYDLHGAALDPNRLASNWFNVEGFPTMVVIDPGGDIRATWPGLNPAIQLNMANAVSQLRLQNAVVRARRGG
ncbi:MAG: TlpA family protein disulfide reductase [Candidatus Eremiobacteraeota bacterium]|nr:TlpA family protein disulfide reductase [Candidatus Eremiobacteraeota bacterium]